MPEAQDTKGSFAISIRENCMGWPPKPNMFSNFTPSSGFRFCFSRSCLSLAILISRSNAAEITSVLIKKILTKSLERVVIQVVFGLNLQRCERVSSHEGIQPDPVDAQVILIHQLHVFRSLQRPLWLCNRRIFWKVRFCTGFRRFLIMKSSIFSFSFTTFSFLSRTN